MAKAKKTKGRPSKFDNLDMGIIETCVKKGFTDKEIADMLKITVRTFHNWKKENEDFFHSLKEWKKEADEKVERSLYERAIGYSCPDVHIFAFKGRAVITDIVKHYPPDATSMIFWLKNRKPQQWRDRVDAVSSLTDEQTDALRKLAVKEMSELL